MPSACGLRSLRLALRTMRCPNCLTGPSTRMRLGVLGFWTNLVFYPIIGAHHFEFSPLPWWFQTLAIVFQRRHARAGLGRQRETSF